MERMYTKQEAKEIAVEAVRLYAAENPVPTHVTAIEAAGMLGVSTKTISRMRLPRNKFGKIAYRDVLDAAK